MKYIKYERDFGEIELEAYTESPYTMTFPFYVYGLIYDPFDNLKHQQFVKWTKEGCEGYSPLSIDFDYDEDDQTFSNIYAEFCVYDTIAQQNDSSRIIIIKGLKSD